MEVALMPTALLISASLETKTMPPLGIVKYQKTHRYEPTDWRCESHN